MDEVDLDNIINNRSFCAVPFVSMMVDTSSTIRFCCIASGSDAALVDSDKKRYLAGKNSISEAWTSENLKQVRKAMVNGDTISACKNCYHQESIGKSSNRKMMTNEWIQRVGKEEFTNIVSNLIHSDYNSKLDIIYLDLRLGNLCNLKCRMCSPFNSSQIAKEHFDLWDEGNQSYKDIWTGMYGKSPEHLRKDQTWFESNFLWDELIGLIPSLKKVYMTGGEPTLIENNYRFMQECIAANMQDTIELFFNINCTNVTDKFINLISQFKTVKINASLDGFGPMNDYIRFPSKWDRVSKNFERLVELPHVIANVTPVVQVYNALDCVNMLYYVDMVSQKYNRDVGLDFLINRHPHHLDVTILPNSLRVESAQLLRQYKASSNRYNENWLIKNSVDSIINLMESPRHNDYDRLLKVFYTMTITQDEKRSQSFKDVCPAIYGAIKDEV